jgi:dynein heavy chain
LINELQKINRELENIQKSIISYLENKRKSFSRFYFVSNDDLIEILSKSKDFDNIQQHLPKIFENIKTLEMNNIELIESMQSQEGEVIKFVRPDQLGDNINETLKKIETCMVNTVKQIIKTGINKLQNETESRNEWLFRHSAQVIVTCDAIQWTESTGLCLSNEDPIEEMLVWSDTLKIQLDEVINLVRGNLSEVHRKTLTS